jgi:hypothetical protein
MTQKKTWAWSYQQKFSDLRNFQKKSEKYLGDVLAWLAY